MCSTHARGFCFSDDLYQIASTEGGARLLFAEVDFGYGDLTAVYGRDGKKLRGFAYRIDVDGQRSDSERDDYGCITVERDPLGRETCYLYDTKGNVIAITAPDGSSTQIDYHETLNLPVAKPICRP